MGVQALILKQARRLSKGLCVKINPEEMFIQVGTGTAQRHEGSSGRQKKDSFPTSRIENPSLRVIGSSPSSQEVGDCRGSEECPPGLLVVRRLPGPQHGGRIASDLQPSNNSHVVSLVQGVTFRKGQCPHDKKRRVAAGRTLGYPASVLS